MIVRVARGAPQQVVGDTGMSKFGSVRASHNDCAGIEKFLHNRIGVASDIVFKDSRT